jgi:formyltetrahydrofolate-dependent phosphoribosylglycinamide formyltransferase
MRLGVLISGRGSNLSALLDLREEVGIRVVVSSRPEAYGLLRARRAGVATFITPFRDSTHTKIDWIELTRRLEERGVTHLFLAGFMKIVPASFVEYWRGRILNLHPSLLPSYPGLDSIARAYADGAEIGVSVHEVNEEVDAGRIISQRRSLNRAEVREYSLGSAEFLVHVDEQRIVKHAIRVWRGQQIDRVEQAKQTKHAEPKDRGES